MESPKGESLVNIRLFACASVKLSFQEEKGKRWSVCLMLCMSHSVLMWAVSGEVFSFVSFSYKLLEPSTI